jgi:hypothetical protein
VKLDAAYLFYYATNHAALRWRQFPAIAALLDLKKKECTKQSAAEREHTLVNRRRDRIKVAG